MRDQETERNPCRCPNGPTQTTTQRERHVPFGGMALSPLLTGERRASGTLYTLPMRKNMKILFVFLMLAANWAYAEDLTSDDYHAMAVALAKCSGYWKVCFPKTHITLNQAANRS